MMIPNEQSLAQKSNRLNLHILNMYWTQCRWGILNTTKYRRHAKIRIFILTQPNIQRISTRSFYRTFWKFNKLNGPKKPNLMELYNYLSEEARKYSSMNFDLSVFKTSPRLQTQTFCDHLPF